MIHRIEISTKIPDTRALMRKHKLEADGNAKKIKEIFLVDVYTIHKKYSQSQLRTIASTLINPVTQDYSIDMAITPQNFTWAIEIGFLPGVTDNIATTVKETIEDVLRDVFVVNENVYSSQVTFITGNFTDTEIQKIASRLYNPLIQRATIKNRSTYQKDKGMGKIIPLVKLDMQEKVDEVNLNVNDEELTDIGKKGISNGDGSRRGPLALSLKYMKTIRSYFKKKGRNPTDIELESIAQTWSEHCKHTIFANPIDDDKRGLFRTYIKAATEKIRKSKSNDFCYSVFTDNSGAIEFDDHYLITHKVETHNSPSALDPFGGALTGIVGVNRDAIGFGMGAKPIINQYGFCLAHPDDMSSLYKGIDFTQKMLSPRRIMDGVISGVNVGGNCSGIPTPQGFMFFDKKYKGKPLIFVGTVGLIPKRIKGKKMYVKKAKPGDYIVMVGGRVGVDGIHGATFSSEVMDSGSPSTAVQIGDPITQKKLSDVLVKEARELDLYSSITDNGAGGLSCSVAEMAKESGGFQVQLDRVPLKYPGLASWQIWISESQERMTLAVPKNKWSRFSSLMRRRGVEATIIGTFTSTKRCIVTFENKIIIDMDMKFLHDGLPSRPMRTSYQSKIKKESAFAQPKNLTHTLFTMLRRHNIAGFEFLSMQYDHEVQGGSVLKPLQGMGRVNADASVTRPVLSSKKGVVLSQSLYPTYSDSDPYHMAAASIDGAIRNVIASGADINKIALLDNFCWCSSDDPYRLGQLRKATQACYDYSIGYQTPFISGKDSMFNDFKGFDHKGKPINISIPPTLLISAIGVLDDSEKALSIDMKFPDDLIYILGETYEELGGSEYFGLHSRIGTNVPKVNFVKNKKMYMDFYRCVQSEIICSAISVGRGGLAIALARTAMAGLQGVEVELQKVPGNFKRDDFGLFSESQGRILLTISPKNKDRFEKLMKKNPYACIGRVSRGSTFTIKGKKGRPVIDTEVVRLLRSYRSTFKDY